YVCENNLYNEYTHYRETTAGQFSARAAAFDIFNTEVDGQDVLAVNAAAMQMSERARRGDGPAFLLCNTYRYRGHHVGDINRSYYRSKEEEQEWMMQRDPIARLADWMIAKRLTERSVLDRIHADVQAEIEAGAQFARDAPFPDVSEVTQHVYA